MNEVHAISLKEIQELIRSGYNNQPICVFSEGYGTKTEHGAAPNYLIPVNSTHFINKESKEFVELHCAEHLIIDIEKCVYVNKSGFYHIDRQCRFIKNKSDSEVRVMNNEIEAKAAGYISCKGCCVK